MPLQKKARGSMSTPWDSHIALWLKREKIKWFLMRSLPDTLKSIGYQYSKDFLHSSSWSLGTFMDSLYSPFKKM